MKRCNACGGDCYETSRGVYRCNCCGNIFSSEDFTVAKRVSQRKISDSGADVFEKNVACTLEILCQGKFCGMSGSNCIFCDSSGSGYIITDSGYAITNAHVVVGEANKPCENIVVKVNGQSVAAKVTAFVDKNERIATGVDLAILKLEYMPNGARKVEFRDSDDIRIGEKVYVIGNSLGDGTCITGGIVSDKNRNVYGNNFIMTDCAVNSGNSGGPLFDSNGFLIGTITFQGRVPNGGDAEGMNYAIPSNVVRAFIKKNRIY